MRLMDIYDRMPLILQNIAVSSTGHQIQKRRYGSDFNKQYNEYMNRNQWSYHEKCKYRDAQIHKIVEHSYKSVPYYKRVMLERGLTPDDFFCLDDLKKLPIIDKQIVKKYFNDFFSSEYDKKRLIRLHTSGSTGSGFAFYEDEKADAAVWAHVWRGYENLGLKRNVWCGYFGGRKIVPVTQKKPPFYRMNYPGKQIMFSIYHMNSENMKSYIQVLNQFQPPWIQGYPSTLAFLALYMMENRAYLKYQPEWITVSSESISEKQTQTIQKAFGVYPYQNYAQSEAVATFRQRLDKRMFVDEDFSAVEFIPEQDGICRIIGTSLTNYAMPLLRYDTKDFATYIETEEGREIITLEGRMEDEISLPDGRKIRRVSRIFQKQFHILEAQIYQKKDTSLCILIHKDLKYTEIDEKNLRREIDEYFHGSLKYQIEYVEQIPKQSNGKTRFIISEL